MARTTTSLARSGPILLLALSLSLATQAHMYALAASSLNFNLPAARIPLTRDRCDSANGFPSSPKTIAPFTRPWRAIPTATPKYSHCDAQGRCVDYFELTAQYNPIQVFPKGPATIFRSYNKILLGPTIKQCRGRQTVLRVFNNLTGPISTHLHGAATIAPSDGWADNTVLNGQYKDYHYPNNRAATLWYHDHAVHVTADNAYHTLAGQYWVTDCTHPLEPIIHPKFDSELTIADVVFSADNQLLMDTTGAHSDNLYGDINTVNGVAFPFFNVEPRKYRFRVLNAAVTRLFMLRLSNGLKFHVVASDGGFLEKPVLTDHLRHGAGERWEIVVDFRGQEGREILLLNDDMPGVPMFCRSHLLVKFIVGRTRGPEPDLPLPLRFYAVGDFPLNSARVDPARIQDALATKPENHLDFDRSGGQWTINGVGWADVAHRIQVTVRPNELSPWRVTTGGGWYHPVHLHLIDFIILKREKADTRFSPSADPITGLEPYEIGAAKDVVILGPGEEIQVIARYGPHVGSYMVHCHNLIHEDDDMLVAFSVAGADAGEVPGSPLPTSPANLEDPMSQVARPNSALRVVNQCYLQTFLENGSYRVFYPSGQATAPNHRVNPNNFWEVMYSKEAVHQCCSRGASPPACA